jgi:hypothetical protein
MEKSLMESLDVTPQCTKRTVQDVVTELAEFMTYCTVFLMHVL